MFPTPDEIKNSASIELDYMLRHGYNHGEIEISFPRFETKLKVFIRNGKMEYAKVTEHPKGIFPNIDLKS